jgi:hypothetical protein
MLAGVRTTGSGPSGQSVTPTLPLPFKQSAAGQVFTIQVGAHADDGADQPPADADTIQIGSPGVPAVPSPNNDDEPHDKPDRPRKETEDDRRQREHTNQGNEDDIFAEGNVTEVHRDEQPPYVVIGNRDGLVRVVLRCGEQCPTVQVGDYLQADGQKEHDALFYADQITIWRNGEKVK